MLIIPRLQVSGLIPPFQDSLPFTLRRYGEQLLFEAHSFTRTSYTTRSFITEDIASPALQLRSFQLANGSPFSIEGTSPEVLKYCTDRDLRLASDSQAEPAIELLQEAISTVIRSQPFLWNSLSELAWRCHIILAENDDYDVSFSDPSIPFSLFVSAPVRQDRQAVLRVAENLIHETMHLQLTLFEGLCPLIDTSRVWSMYSPWKQAERPAQGVLHGLYVFTILRWMWQMAAITSTNAIDRKFAQQRISEINEEVRMVRQLENSPALTEAGSQFLDYLFAQNLFSE
jgi:hypothetical protein